MSSLANLEWRLVSEERHHGPMQMALDEVAAETVATGGPATVRVYRWEPSTLSLGYGQDDETVDWSYCKRHGIDVTRRQTGGGGIYHDSWGDISYSVVLPADAVPANLLDCYELLCEPVLEAFERMGIEAAFAETATPAIHEPACYLRAIEPVHDVLAGERKISGNAQYRQRDAVVQHGSLSYALADEFHRGVFDAELAHETFHDRVTAITERVEIDRQKAVQMLEAALADWAGATPDEWTDPELDSAAELAEQKYASEDWTRHRLDPTQD